MSTLRNLPKVNYAENESSDQDDDNTVDEPFSVGWIDHEILQLMKDQPGLLRALREIWSPSKVKTKEDRYTASSKFTLFQNSCVRLILPHDDMPAFYITPVGGQNYRACLWWSAGKVPQSELPGYIAVWVKQLVLEVNDLGSEDAALKYLYDVEMPRLMAECTLMADKEKQRVEIRDTEVSLAQLRTTEQHMERIHDERCLMDMETANALNQVRVADEDIRIKQEQIDKFAYMDPARQASQIPIRRDTLTPQERNKLWGACFRGWAGRVKCPLCHINIISRDNFEAGHIIARAKGGPSDVLGNYRPICGQCNKKEGCNRMYGWEFLQTDYVAETIPMYGGHSPCIKFE